MHTHTYIHIYIYTCKHVYACMYTYIWIFTYSFSIAKSLPVTLSNNISHLYPRSPGGGWYAAGFVVGAGPPKLSGKPGDGVEGAEESKGWNMDVG